MSKRILALLICLLVIVAGTACTASDKADESAAGNPEDSVAAEDIAEDKNQDNASDSDSADSNPDARNAGSISDSEDETPEPFIAVVDYDTEDATRVLDKLQKAGCECERVGSVEKLDVDKYDAIVIPGGHSVTPAIYGAERDPSTTKTDYDKDIFQITAVQRFAAAGKPVLGICRGMQLVNNAFGGTTIQDMPEGWHKKDWDVIIAEGTWLYDLFGKEETTYHYHHQCVDELGEGLYATQWDAVNGHIEAFEHKTLPVYGVQWHPDSMDEKGVEVFRVFRETVTDNMKNGPAGPGFKVKDTASDTIKELAEKAAEY